MPALAASAQLRQNPQPTGWLQKRPKLGAGDLEFQRQQRRQEAKHKKQRQEAARANKRQRLEGDGRFAQEGVRAKLRELQAKEAVKLRELQGLQAVKAKLRELQENGEVRPDPTPATNPVAEARKKLQALELCQTCPNCQWTPQKTKGCKACLGQYSSKLRCTQYSLEHQRQVVSQLTGTSA